MSLFFVTAVQILASFLADLWATWVGLRSIRVTRPLRELGYVRASSHLVGLLNFTLGQGTIGIYLAHTGSSVLEASLATILERIIVHHTNNSSSIQSNESKQQSRGYAALGYHFFIDGGGRVYEGRPLEVMGSHAGVGRSSGPLNDPDWGSIGIVLQGDYHHADDWLWHSVAPQTQLDTLSSLIVALRRRQGRASAASAAVVFIAFGVSDIVETTTGAWWRPSPARRRWFAWTSSARTPSSHRC